MKLNIANLVAIQFGIFLGTMSWLVYSRLEPTEPRTAEKMPPKMVNSIPPDAPVSELKNQHPRTIANRTDREQGPTADDDSAESAPSYYRMVATSPYTRSGFDNAIAEAPPSYADVAQEPSAVSADYAASTEPGVYVQPTQFIPYAEPIQTVVFSAPRHFANRRRHVPRTFGPRTNPFLSLNTLSSGPSGNVLSSGPSGNVLSSGPSGNVLSPVSAAIRPIGRPVQGSRPRRNH